MIYDDGKYHVEKRMFTYLGGYEQADWTIVNTFGELCRRKHITIRFDT